MSYCLDHDFNANCAVNAILHFFIQAKPPIQIPFHAATPFEMEILQTSHYRLLPAGECAIMIEFAEEISLDALQTRQSLQNILLGASIQGLREIVPAYTTLCLCFEPDVFALYSSSILQQLYSVLHSAAGNHPHSPEEASLLVLQQTRTVNIPCCFESEFAPDLDECAKAHDLSIDELVKQFIAAEYRVAMMGFLPGFPYLLGLPKHLTMPRKNQPRVSIEAGSVGIGGEQTGIYPFRSPGGWNIIGRTPLPLFTPHSRNNELETIERITLLQSGDRVRFVSISAEEFFLQQHLYATRNIFIPQSSAKPVLEKSLADAVQKKIHIFQKGFSITIQDQGRKDMRGIGIPESGAVETFSAEFANTLIGNTSNDALFEIPFGIGMFYFPEETLFALWGKDIHAEAALVGFVENSAKMAVSELNEKGWFPVQSSRPVLMRAGTILRCKHCQGARIYAAFEGGCDVPMHLHSRSTYLRAQLGGLNGRALQNGDFIPLGEPSLFTENIRIMLKKYGRHFPSHSEARFYLPFQTYLKKNSTTLRIQRGAEWNAFDDVSIHQLLTGKFQVLSQSDRMGMRLKYAGNAQEILQSTIQPMVSNLASASNLIRPKELVSRPVQTGTLQSTPDGTLILLLADAQTTGGYPVIAHVCKADLDAAAQYLPNEHLTFTLISEEEARKAYIEQEKRKGQLKQALRLKLSIR